VLTAFTRVVKSVYWDRVVGMLLWTAACDVTGNVNIPAIKATNDSNIAIFLNSTMDMTSWTF